jgi:hypothetical protein
MRRTPSKGAADKSDKELLGRTLSALANSMGGLLLWGVDARRGQNNIDAVSGFEPIADVARLRAKWPVSRSTL